MRITRHDEFRARRYDPGLSSARRPKKRSRVHVPRFVPYLFVFVLSAAALVLVSRLDQLQLAEVQIVGARSEDQARLESVVEDELAGYYAWVVPRRNAFLFSKERIAAALSAAAPRLETTAVEQIDLRKLVVAVVERAPVAIACSAAQTLCHFVDHNGLLFARAPNISGNLFLGVVLPEDRLRVGEQAFSSDVFKKFFEMRTFLDSALGAMPYAARVGALEFEIEDETPRYSFGVLVPGDTASSWRVKIPAEFEVAELAGRIGPAIKTLASDARKPDARTLEYVDFRFGNRVFYKYK